jgi:hypothetical protein
MQSISVDKRDPLLIFGEGDRREERWRTFIKDGDRYNGVVFGWDSLCQLAGHLGRGWLYRGQSQMYALRPRIGRDDARKDMNVAGRIRPYTRDGERELLADFALRSRPYVTNTPATKLEWMAVARHHGVPTRLLDWSESFMAAALFACKNSGLDNRKYFDPEICVIKGIPDVVGDDPFGVADVCLYRPPHITPRIPAQQGLFTLHPDPVQSLDDHSQLQRWAIVAESAFHIKKMLAVAGINESTINPTLDGLAEHLAWRYKWGI